MILQVCQVQGMSPFNRRLGCQQLKFHGRQLHTLKMVSPQISGPEPVTGNSEIIPGKGTRPSTQRALVLQGRDLDEGNEGRSGSDRIPFIARYGTLLSRA
jgi:hypothetical protein